MKKFLILVATVLALSSSAFATPSVKVEATHTRGSDNSLAIVPSIDVKDLTVDARLESTRTLNGLNSTAVEIRATKSFNVAPSTSVFLRAGVGKNFSYRGTTYTSYSILPGKTIMTSTVYLTPISDAFYSIEPGIKFAVTPAVSVKISDRYTNTFHHNTRATVANEVGVEADVAVNKTDYVGVKVFKQYGGLTGKGVQLAYTRNF